MRAIVYYRYGSPEVLQLAEVARPEPREDELLIRVKAVEVTKADCEMRSFRFAVNWFWLPLRLALGIRRPRKPILGAYFAGEVAATAAENSRFKPGDAVFGATQMRLGAYAEYLAVPEHYTLVPKPPQVSFAAAAAVPLGGLNALHFLNLAGLRSGEDLLIIGAGGSIGLLATQIAKARGARVTAVDKTSKEAVVLQAGADVFVDYTRQDPGRLSDRFDVVFSMVAGGSYRMALGLLKPTGRYLMGNPRLSDMVRSFLTGWFSSRKAYFAFASESLAELEELAAMLESGELRPLVDRTFTMDQAAEAHTWVESEKRNGSIVLEMANDETARAD
ncbi:MAG: NAD(P)-dependent alcohol dehydrogenase [Synoicihabitans sp.]